MSVRRKTYLLVAATLLVAAAAIFSVSQAVFVRDGQWTRDVLSFSLALVGVVLVLGVAVCVILEASLFRKIGRLTAQVRVAGSTEEDTPPITIKGRDELAVLATRINEGFQELRKTRGEHEQQSHELATALEELKARHSDLETAHRHLQQLQEASASLGGRLEITDALGQLEEVALSIFEADEAWLLQLVADQQQLIGLRAFTSRSTGYPQLPTLFGCAGSDGVLSVEGNHLFNAVFRGAGPLFIESVTEICQEDRDKF
ncbi:MAG: hypothetical protein JW990_11150, partial [Thermoleophilia bacterium]|nr:hypothetical protein [Thermoleophilia bacterium]